MRKTFLLIFILFLTACGPTPGQRAATQTAVVVTADARGTAIGATLEAKTSPTPDQRPKDVKCAESGVGVRYHLSDKNVGTVSLTLENDSGGTEQMDEHSPYCRTFTGFEHGDFVYISAQITGGTGELTCRIWYQDKVIAEATAKGEYKIATCSGQIP